MQKNLRMTGIEPATFGSLQNSLGKHHVTWNESSCIRVYVTMSTNEGHRECTCKI